MKQTKAPELTPSPSSKEQTPRAVADKSARTPTMIFLWAVADISWQMAIVVLVPILGGYEIDRHVGTTPVLTIVGFVLAMIGVFIVIKKALKDYGNTMSSSAKEQK